MQEQLDLDIPEPEGFGVPKAPEPLFWVRELRLLSKWVDGESEEIRRVRLRRGLNVVWSSPTPVAADADQRISGHASGKSTFCRMLRYVLGEERIGTEEFRNAATHVFPNGWVVAEIRLDGETWCVARPLTMWTASKGLTLRGVLLDDFLSGKYKLGAYTDFVTAMEKAAKKIVPYNTLPDGSRIGIWHYFPWFTRDQEVQFSRLNVWRVVDSPTLKQDQKSFIMRSIYNPMAKDELNLIREYERLTGVIEDAQEALSGFTWTCKENLEWIENFQELSGIDMKNDLAVDAIVTQLANERNSLSELPEQMSNELEKLQSEYNAAERDYEDSKYVQHRRVCILNTEIATLNDLEHSANIALTPQEEEPPESQVRAAARLYPGRRYCAVPLDWALMSGCKEAQKYAEGKKQREEERKAANAIVREQAEITLNDQRQKVRDIKSLIDNGRKDVEQARIRFLEAKQKYLELKTELERKLAARRDVITKSLTAIDRYRDGARKLAETSAQIENARKKRKEIAGSLSALRKSGSASAGIRDYFFQVAKYVFGNMVIGEVIEDKDAIYTRCIYKDAPCQSAAIDAALNVVFDLTVLVMAIQGRSTHPRFLVHDGPRVADISPAIYHRYFEFAEDLERRANDEPNFQYIITTTEPPPERFKKEPYLCLELDASKPELRLLKCDLN